MKRENSNVYPSSYKSTGSIQVARGPPVRTLSSMTYKEALLFGILKAPVIKYLFSPNHRPTKTPATLPEPLELPPIAEETTVSGELNDNVEMEKQLPQRYLS